MTDKQIIIDGVDISECKCYIEGIKGIICISPFISHRCSKNPNCVYKQLKRKEQTLKEIKEIAEPYCNACAKFRHGKGRHCKYCNYSKILQKIRESEIKHES